MEKKISQIIIVMKLRVKKSFGYMQHNMRSRMLEIVYLDFPNGFGQFQSINNGNSEEEMSESQLPLCTRHELSYPILRGVGYPNPPRNS